MVTGLCRRLTYNSWGALHTVMIREEHGIHCMPCSFRIIIDMPCSFRIIIDMLCSFQIIIDMPCSFRIIIYMPCSFRIIIEVLREIDTKGKCDFLESMVHSQII